MIFQFVNQQSRFKPQPWRDLLQGILPAALDAVPWGRHLQAGPYEPSVTVILVGPRTMRRINRETRLVDQTTDVLSFPLLDMTDGKRAGRLRPQDFEQINDDRQIVPLGEILISLDRAAVQAGTYGHTMEREVVFLAVHGLLHLLGYDHDDPEREKRMRRKQRQIMRLKEYHG